jgi:hypothetical protein
MGKRVGDRQENPPNRAVLAQAGRWNSGGDGRTLYKYPAPIELPMCGRYDLSENPAAIRARFQG